MGLAWIWHGCLAKSPAKTPAINVHKLNHLTLIGWWGRWIEYALLWLAEWVRHYVWFWGINAPTEHLLLCDLRLVQNLYKGVPGELRSLNFWARTCLWNALLPCCCHDLTINWCKPGCKLFGFPCWGKFFCVSHYLWTEPQLVCDLNACQEKAKASHYLCDWSEGFNYLNPHIGSS